MRPWRARSRCEPENFDLARLFYEMASLLEARDESVFRVRAYQRAAPRRWRRSPRTWRPWPPAAAHRPARHRPRPGRPHRGVPGHRPHRPARRRSAPSCRPGSSTLLEIRGLGPRTARALCEQLGVDSVERLEALCRSQADHRRGRHPRQDLREHPQGHRALEGRPRRARRCPARAGRSPRRSPRRCAPTAASSGWRSRARCAACATP